MRRAHPSPLVVCAALLSLWLAGGCEDESDPQQFSCVGETSGALLDGRWSLQAQGARSGCEDEARNGALTLRTAAAFEVMAQEQFGIDAGFDDTYVNDAFVLRIAGSDFALEANGLPSEVEFSGSASGACLSFTLSESLAGSDALDYSFSGRIESSSVAVGTFTGRGPGTCRVTGGTFTLRLQ